jgi:hypothetical protein
MSLSIRLTICFNDVPVGPRLERGSPVIPLPHFKHTYNDTPDGREQAEAHMEAIQRYVDKYHAVRHG